jgi:hypothetical protein
LHCRRRPALRRWHNSGHQALGQRSLADALGPVQQIRMGVLAATGQLLPERCCQG